MFHRSAGVPRLMRWGPRFSNRHYILLTLVWPQRSEDWSSFSPNSGLSSSTSRAVSFHVPPNECFLPVDFQYPFTAEDCYTTHGHPDSRYWASSLGQCSIKFMVTRPSRRQQLLFRFMPYTVAISLFQNISSYIRFLATRAELFLHSLFLSSIPIQLQAKTHELSLISA